MDTWMKVKQDVVPSLFSAGASLLIYGVGFQYSLFDNVAVAGAQLPVALVVGSSVFLSQLLGNALEYQVLPYIPQNSMAGLEGQILKPTLAALSLYGMNYFFISSDASLFQSVVLGAGSVVVGDYTTRLLGY
jgi:hypothetical protein